MSWRFDHATTAPALQATHLAFSRERRVVLRDVDLCVDAGQIVGLLGDNGAGKTTLLQCLAGALRPSAGQVLWFGQQAARSVASRKLVGFLGHESGLYLGLGARENLLLAARLYGLAEPAERAAELLELMSVRHQAEQPVARLSRGTRQRVALARAVIHDPAILILDEPFASLDAGGSAWLAGYLRQMRDRHCAIVLSSHNSRHCRDLADSVLSLQAARLYAVEESSAEIQAEPGVYRRTA